MAENGYGAAGHIGRIPNYGKHNVNPMGTAEPPACIQNAMMTKDKKPFTYTPGGLDLSQIKTPSMVRRMARQRSQEEHEQAYAQQGYPTPAYHPQGGPAPPPPPPPPTVPAPPPPPALVIPTPKSKSPKPIAPGERPEIVIPENPIGMLRKTNSPYHWEAEKAELERIGPIPKFQEKRPSPLTVTMPPSSFSQQPPQTFAAQGNFQRQNYQPESAIHRPEAQYAHQKSSSPNINGSPVTRELLQRQDSQFNKSPQPFSGQSPVSNGSPYSPTPNNNWRQPDKRDSPANNLHNPQSPQQNRNQFSPNVQQFPPEYQNQSSPGSGPYHTLPRTTPRIQDNYVNNIPSNNVTYNNQVQQGPKDDPATWRTNTVNRPSREPDNLQSIYHNSKINNQQPSNTAPWHTNESKNNQAENAYIPPWKEEARNATHQQNQQQTLPQQMQYNPNAVHQQNQQQTLAQQRQFNPNAAHQQNQQQTLAQQRQYNPNAPHQQNQQQTLAQQMQYNPNAVHQQNQQQTLAQQRQFNPNAAHQQNQQQTLAQQRQYNPNAAHQQNQQQTLPQQSQFNPPWVFQDNNNNRTQENYTPPWRTQNNNAPVSPPNRNQVQEQPRYQQNQSQEPPRYQSSMSIPVTPRKQNTQPENNNNQPAPQREVVYVNQEPVYYCPDSPKPIPPWVKTQKEKTKTPPPAWVNRPLEGRKSAPRELVTPPRETEPEWVRLSNEKQRAARDLVSPPKYTQPAQPTWSTKPSENRKSIPKDNATSQAGQQGSRIIPVQVEASNIDQGRQGQPMRTSMNINTNSQPPNQGPNQAPYSQPTQRIIRVLSPQLVRLDDGPTQPDLPSLNRSFQNQSNQDNGPITRIIPIQIEGGNGGANKRVYFHKFKQEGPPRQSKAFRVLQVITGTQDEILHLESRHGFSDL